MPDLRKDVLLYAQERKRMCDSFGIDCNGCPLETYAFCAIDSVDGGGEISKRILDAVQNWSDSHPTAPDLLETELKKLLEKFGYNIHEVQCGGFGQESILAIAAARSQKAGDFCHDD